MSDLFQKRAIIDYTIIKNQNACASCEHYLTNRTCTAFAEKIPDVIWAGDNDHSENISGDNGVKYNPLQMR